MKSKFLVVPFLLSSIAFAPAQSAIKTNDIVRHEKQNAMDVAINEAIAEGKCPGGVLWLEHGNASFYSTPRR